MSLQEEVMDFIGRSNGEQKFDMVCSILRVLDEQCLSKIYNFINQTRAKKRKRVKSMEIQNCHQSVAVATLAQAEDSNLSATAKQPETQAEDIFLGFDVEKVLMNDNSQQAAVICIMNDKNETIYSYGI